MTSSTLLWKVTLASVLGFLLLWWVARGAPRWARRRSLHQCLDRLGARPEGAGAAMESAFARARQALQAGAARPRSNALYRAPWVLFLGDAESRVSDLLRVANAESTPLGDARESFWRWWPMPQLMAIECDPRLVEPGTNADSPAGRELLGSWYQALLALADKRGALPLDGVVLCVDAASLLAGPQAAAELAARLRQRADEASQQLHLRLPTQVLVTGLDRLPGYAAVRDALPEEVLAQAVGFRVPPGTLVVIDDVLADLSERLRALCMALLRQQADAPGRLAVHEFFQQWLALRLGLGAFLKRLFAASTAPYRLRGRGLYFVAAPEGSKPPAFVAELFTRFLPLERAFPRLRK